MALAVQIGDRQSKIRNGLALTYKGLRLKLPCAGLLDEVVATMP